jgi:hypothetical protein
VRGTQNRETQHEGGEEQLLHETSPTQGETYQAFMARSQMVKGVLLRQSTSWVLRRSEDIATTHSVERVIAPVYWRMQNGKY